MLLALATLWAWTPGIRALLLLMAPLIVDGTIQRKTRYESTNFRRCVTGLLFGYAMIGGLWWLLRSGYRDGLRIGSWIRNR